MAIIIDGYNLMHAAGLVGRGVGPGGLERSRLALLNFVAEAIEVRDLATTTVVFDAQRAPPGLPGTLTYRGMTVRFAAEYESADELIEHLIRVDSSPRRLLVVSADHRLHRAARHRRAKAVDSERWYAEMLRRRAARHDAGSSVSSKPNQPAAGEVEYWLRRLTDEAVGPLAESDDIFPPGYGEDIEE
jgi:predicted RNA-binding protein with PIN domain